MVRTKAVLIVIIGLVFCAGFSSLSAQNSVDPQNVDVVITPDETDIEVGETLQLEVFAFNITGNRAPVRFDSIEWKVSSDSLGTLTEDGFFIAGKYEGRVVVIARIRVGDRVIERRVIIIIRARSHSRAFEVEVIPHRAVVLSSGEQQFEAVIRGRDGRTLRPDHVRWDVQPDDLGKISEDGLFVAGDQQRHGKVVALVELDGIVVHGAAKVVISAPATGAIAGQVTHENTPSGIEGAKVRAVRLGEVYWVGMAETDADGNYLIGDLIPGFYVLYSNARGFIGEFYDNTQNYLEATPLNIAESDTSNGIDFGLSEGGSISGTVFSDSDTTPIPEAHVVAFLIVNPRFARNVMTDENGDYTIDAMPSGAYGVRANAIGYRGEFFDDALERANLTPVTVLEPNAVGGIDFSLGISGAISGLVSEDSQGGEAIARAHVVVFKATRSADGALSINRRSFREARTDEHGRYIVQVGPGAYHVFASAEGFNGEFYDNKESVPEADVVEVLADAHTSDINFALSKRGSISGQVTDQVTGDPIAGAVVEAFKENVRVDAEAQRDGFRAKTDDAGNYLIENVPAGNYLVVAGAREYLHEFYQESPDKSGATLVAVEAAQGVTEIDFTLESGGSIAGFVGTAADSTPVSRALIQVWNTETKHGRRAYTDERGNYSVAGLPSGNYVVQAIAEGFLPVFYQDARHRRDATPVEVASPDETSEIHLFLKPIERKQGTLAGRIVSDEDESPLHGATVIAVLLRNRQPFITFSGPRGFYELTDIPAGKYYVSAWAEVFVGEFFKDAQRFKDAEPVLVHSEEVNDGINFGLRPQRQHGAYAVRGRIRDAVTGDPLEGVSVVAKVAGEVEVSAVTDSDGRYVIEGLPGGTYQVEANGVGYEEGHFGGSDEANAADVPVGNGSDAVAVDIDLEIDSVTSVGSAELASAPETFDLFQNYPNPFNPETTIRYQLGRASEVSLKIFNILGQEIKTLINEERLAGSYAITWDGKDNLGRQAASGIYIFRLTAGDVKMSKRMLLLK